MLKHCVFLNLKPDSNKADQKEVFEILAGLKGEIPELVSLEYGENLDFEKKSQAYSDGFIATFIDRQAHLEYEAHPEHVKASGRLVDMCVGGHEGIVVFDLEVG